MSDSFAKHRQRDDLEPRSLTSSPPPFSCCCTQTADGRAPLTTTLPSNSTMMKLALLTTLLAGASAFAPASTNGKATTTTTALNGAFDNEIGAASAELGCWDPLGYVTDGDKKRFDHLRGVELKHGRIAMLATWGYATTWSGARFPGCEDFPAGHEVRNTSCLD